MMKRKLFLLLTLILTWKLFALQWSIQIEHMSSSFLDNEDGLVTPCLEFTDYASMRPFDDGDVVFRMVAEDYAALPGCEESLLVLEHDNGFQSIYASISPDETRQDRNSLTSGEFLKAPSDYLGEGSFCRFYIRDAHLDQIVNPLIVLPGVQDKYKPVIDSLLLVDSKRSYNLKDQMEMPVGNYQVYARARDVSLNQISVSPYLYTLYNLGSVLLERRLDAVILKDSKISLKDGEELKSAFFRPGYIYLGEMTLTSGMSKLELFVADSFGNEASLAYEVMAVR